MVNVVVVDDEERIRQGLAKLITQAGDEFIVTGIFSSGQELLSNIDMIKVNLVITDIKMPMMNGLELIEKLQIRYPKLKVAIVSGFDEFSFARQALRFGVEEYLLKPIDRDELGQLLHKVRQKLEKEKWLENVTHDDQLKLILINDPAMLPEHLRREAYEELEHMPLFQEAYVIFVIRGEQQLSKDQIQSIVNGWLPNWLTVEWSDHIVLIVGISSSEHADRVREVGQTLMQRLPVNYRGKIGGSDVFRGTNWLREAYRQGQLAMQYAWYDSGNSAFADYARIVRKPQTMNQLFIHLDRELQAELAVFDYKKAEASILNWLEASIKLMPTWIELRESCENVWALINRYGPERTDAAEETALNERIIAGDPQKYGSKEAFITAFQAEARKQLHQLQEIRQESRVIETVKQFIYQHYTEELELNRLAEEVFLTPSYLSKLFKTETGETITDFLISVRIDRAKELLREEFALKTYEVGERVGYADPTYFNKVFKKLVGNTPKEFRDRVR